MKKIYLSILLVVIIGTCLFFGCKRDFVKDNHLDAPKDSIYFKSAMMNDPNIIAAYNSSVANSEIIKKTTYRRHWLKLHRLHIQSGDTTLMAVVLPRKEVHTMIQNTKSAADVEKVWLGLGYGKNSHQMALNVSAFSANIVQFIRNNPDFKKISAGELKSLYTYAFKQIEIRKNQAKKASVFKKVQEYDPHAAGLCHEALDNAANAAVRNLNDQLGTIAESLTVCCILGIADPLIIIGCEAAADIATIRAQDAYNEAFDDAGNAFDICMQGALQSNNSSRPGERSQVLGTMKKKTI